MFLKYVADVQGYFRYLVDEPDETFLNSMTIPALLEVAYDEFRFYISDIDPNQFHRVYTTPAVVNTNELDLDGILLGALVPLDKDRMQQCIRVTTVNTGSTPQVGTIYEPVYSYESLISPSLQWPNKYMLQGTKIIFASVPSCKLRIEYIPYSPVDWTKNEPADIEWIDDMVQFHDLIALIAAKQYMCIDGASNPQILAQHKARQLQLEAFLTRGRLVPANRYVGQDDPYQVF